MQSRKTPPSVTLTIALCVTAMLAFALPGCRAMCEYLGIGVGGAGGTVISGGNPLVTGASAIAGKEAGSKLADVLGADKEYTAKEYRAMLADAAKDLEASHKLIADLQAREPIRVPVPVDRPVPFVPTIVKYGVAALVLWLLFRFRAGVLAWLGSFVAWLISLASGDKSGGGKALVHTTLGLALGGAAADRAKAEVHALRASLGDKRRARLLPVLVKTGSTTTGHTG